MNSHDVQIMVGSPGSPLLVVHTLLHPLSTPICPFISMVLIPPLSILKIDVTNVADQSISIITSSSCCRVNVLQVVH